MNDYWSFASKHFVMRSMPRCMWKFLYHTGCHVFVVAFFGRGRGALDALYVLLKRRVYAMLGLGESAQGVVCLAEGGLPASPPWTEWQTRIKKPCRNYVADGNKATLHLWNESMISCKCHKALWGAIALGTSTRWPLAGFILVPGLRAGSRHRPSLRWFMARFAVIKLIQLTQWPGRITQHKLG